MKMKGRLMFVLFALLCFSTLSQIVHCDAPPEPMLVVTPQYSTTTTGVYITVKVDIVNAYMVYGYQFYMNWSIPILNVTSITQGPFLSKNGFYSTSFVQKKFNTEGYLLVACTQSTGDFSTAQSGNGTLATITFLVETTGTTTLHLYSTILRDFYGTHYDHTTDDGYFSNEIHEVNVDSNFFIVITRSNSVVYNFSLDTLGTKIVFNVLGTGDNFCNVTIPKALLDATDPTQWTVKIDTIAVSRTLGENSTHTFIYFTYIASAHSIQVIGNIIIPEFPSLIPVIALTAAALLALLAKKFRAKTSRFRQSNE